MKKYIMTFATILVMGVVLCGCGKKTEEKNADKISIVTTIFPEYDWVREITKGSENVEITMLLDKGVDLHSFQPSADDIMKVATSDLFVYVGGESDEWAEDALKEAVNKDMVHINLLEALGDKAKEEELVEGMEGEEEDKSITEEEEGPEYDEHVWLSLKNAVFYCELLTEELSKADEKNRSLYEANAKAYIEKLTALDAEYEDAVKNGTTNTILFGDRFPFRYLVDDYSLDYYAAFVGCSAESEASFETITFLAKKVDELSLHNILQIESSDGKIPATIRENTETKDQEILTLDSMQAVTASDVNKGVTYLKIMQDNLKVIKAAIR